jgi:hypothetical protein
MRIAVTLWPNGSPQGLAGYSLSMWIPIPTKNPLGIAFSQHISCLSLNTHTVRGISTKTKDVMTTGGSLSRQARHPLHVETDCTMTTVIGFNALTCKSHQHSMKFQSKNLFAAAKYGLAIILLNPWVYHVNDLERNQHLSPAVHP